MTDPTDTAEAEVPTTLRPSTLDEFVGQTAVRRQLTVVLDAAKDRGSQPDHVLLSGPPGLGKTTLASIVANHMGFRFHPTSGPAFEKAGDLAAILSNLSANEVLFVDEIHRLPTQVEETLYTSMEDGRLDILVGQGPSARTVSLELPPFTLVGATTRQGLLSRPLADRFGLHLHLDFYDTDALARIVTRSAAVLGMDLGDGVAERVASRSRGTPRVANRLLRRVRDYAAVNGHDPVRPDDADAALAMFDIDEAGLDRLDTAVLEAVIHRFGGGPVGLNTLATSIGEEPDTVESTVEPFLLRLGLINRTARGRVATAAGWEHLGEDPPTHAAAAQPELSEGAA